MKLTRYWPVMFEADKRLVDALDLFTGEIDKVTGGKRLMRIYDVAECPTFIAAAKHSALVNARLEGNNLKKSVVEAALNDPGTHQYFHLHRWRATGRVLYDVDARLCRAFADTDLRVKGEDIRLPFPTFYVAVPPELGLVLTNRGTGDHLVDGFMVSDTSRDDLPAYGRRDDDPTFFSEESYHRSFMIMAVGMPKTEDFSQNALVSYTVPMSIDFEYEQWIDALRSDPKWNTAMAVNLDRVRTWVRLILNTVLYLSSDVLDAEQQRLGPSPEQKRRAREGGKAAKRELDAATLPVRFVKIGHRLPRDDNAPRDDKERELSVRFMVRGHWRNQPFGVGRTEHKLIWIKPHWRGPEWAEIVKARVQKVKT